MGFQIRHKEYGVYQGSFMGFGYWHPWSDMPEQGYCKFSTQQEAQDYIDFLCSTECDQPLNRSDLSIEPFDENESNRLIFEGSLAMDIRLPAQTGEMS